MTALPKASYLPPTAWRSREPRVPGTTVVLAIDEFVPGADVYGGINSLEGFGTIPLHWHDDVGEIQYVVAGHGFMLDVDGNERPVRPHDVVFSPAGPSGAHGFRNASSVPLVILFFYPAAGGRSPSMHIIESPA